MHPWTFFIINPQLSWVCWLWRTFLKFVNFKLVNPQVSSCLFVFQVSSMFVDFQVSSSLVCQFSSFLKYDTLNSSSTWLWVPNFIELLNSFWNSSNYDFNNSKNSIAIKRHLCCNVESFNNGICPKLQCWCKSYWVDGHGCKICPSRMK